MIQHLLDVLRLEAHKVSTWIGAALVAALPWADQIIAGITTYLPSLQPYLPENIFKFMGGVSVVGAMLISIYRSHQKVKAST